MSRVHLGSDRRRPSRTVAALAAGAVLIAAPWACTRTRQAPVEPIGGIQRFITEPPQELFDIDSILELEPAFTWTFNQPGALAPWEQSGADLRFRAAGQGLSLQSSGSVVRLTRNVDLSAVAIDQIELRATQLLVSRVILEWAPAGQEFSPERSLAVPNGELQRGEEDTARFWLRRHPHWRGRVARLRLTILMLPQRSLLLHSIRGFRASVSAERLSAAVARPWLVDLDHEVRGALLQPPGLPLDRKVAIPRAGVFRFAYGVPGTVELPVRFSVSIERASAGRRILFEKTVNPGEDGSARWHDAELELTEQAGREMTLRLETESPGSLDPLTGLPAWANPEVISAPQRSSPSVVLILIDTLRADRMSLYGHDRETTPNIDAWAKSSATAFENAVASSPWTLPSHVSLFTGLDAHRHGVNHHLPAPSSLKTLAERLRAAGYSTLAVTGGGYLHPSYGLAQGFDEYRYWAKAGGTGAELETGIARALELIDRHNERPFFLFLHSYEVHSPYEPRRPFFENLTGRRVGARVTIQQRPGLDPERHLARNYFVVQSEDGSGQSQPLAPEDRSLPLDLYDSSIAYTDHHLAQLLGRLRQLPDALLVLTSDHGEMLGEHGLAGHFCLYEQNIMVPLVIEFPDGRGAGRSVRRQTSLVDIVPTILDSLGLEPDAELDGVSLAEVAAGESAGHAVAWSYAAEGNHGLALRVNNRRKYILRNTVWPFTRAPDELYHLDTDPQELANLAATSDESEGFRRELRRALRDETSGLRVRFENRGGGLFRGLLTGEAITNPGVKSEDLECDCVLWGGGKRARLKVPAGQAFTLSLGELRGRRLTLSVPREGGEPFSALIDLSALEQPRSFACGRSGCAERECSGASDACISVWWAGEGRPGQDASPEIDESLQRQLEALGYLN